MAKKRLKLTDQEWLDLIQDCKTSDLKVNTWCEQHGITLKALYYHAQQLRQKGYSIPQKEMASASGQTHDIFQLDISGAGNRAAVLKPVTGTADTAIRIDFHGVFLEISNHAAQDTIENTFHALRKLC